MLEMQQETPPLPRAADVHLGTAHRAAHQEAGSLGSGCHSLATVVEESGAGAWGRSEVSRGPAFYHILDVTVWEPWQK